MRIYFDDLNLAFNTLISKSSREEYDQYISSHRELSSMWNKKRSSEEEDEETRRRKQERGKRRFEEDFEHVNEEFFSSW
jgi:hypothetical protein